MTRTPSNVYKVVRELLDKFNGTKSIGDPVTKYGELVAAFGEDDESVFELLPMPDGTLVSDCTYFLTNNTESGVRLIQGETIKLLAVLNNVVTVVAHYDKNGNDLFVA